MTEYSRFWDADSPVIEPYIYSADEFAQARGRSLWRSGVLLGKDNELEVEAPGGTKTVTVNTGEGVIRGYWYINDASKSLAIDDTVGNPRIDRIVLRWVAATRTITAVVLKGTEAASPSPPALTQTAATWEEPLARIYVANPSVNITSGVIGEDRKFAQPYARTIQRNTNFIRNGHCEGGSRAEWVTSNGAITGSLTQQYYGDYSFRFASSVANGYMRQVLPDEKMYARPYYVRAYVYVSSGTVTMDVNGAGVAKDFPREISSSAASWVLLEGTFMGDGIGDVNVDFIATGNTDVFFVDAVLVMEGGSYDLYVPAGEIATQRNIFVPCVAARNITDGTDIERDVMEGWPMPQSKLSEGYGNWVMPYNYVDGTDVIIDCIAVLPAGGFGFDIRGQNEGAFNTWYAQWDGQTWDSTETTIPCGNTNDVYWLSQIRVTETNIDINEPMFFKFSRNGADAADDLLDDIWFVGWLVYYWMYDSAG